MLLIRLTSISVSYLYQSFLSHSSVSCLSSSVLVPLTHTAIKYGMLFWSWCCDRSKLTIFDHQITIPTALCWWKTPDTSLSLQSRHLDWTADHENFLSLMNWEYKIICLFVICYFKFKTQICSPFKLPYCNHTLFE